MAFLQARKQDTFWEIVGELKWRLDDGSGGGLPPLEPEFDHGGGGGLWPAWATHLIAFLLGGLVWGAVLVAPPMVPLLALMVLVGFVAFAYRRRWR